MLALSDDAVVWSRSMGFRLICAFFLWSSCIAAHTQQSSEAQQIPDLTAKLKNSTVASLQSLIARKYFNVAAIPVINAALATALETGDYKDAKTVADLATDLTGTLYQVSHDKHLFVAVIPPANPSLGKAQSPRSERAISTNFGLKQAEVLDGNVGYLRITDFYRPNEAAIALDNAMKFISHTDAVILDLRVNGGGSPETASQLLSYFFTEPGLPLFSIVPRTGKPVVEKTQVAGVSFRDAVRPVFVLVSAQTWSAGEGVPFILQERHRAVIIGEVTAGAANPASPWPLNDVFMVTVPFGQIRTAVLEKNWDGTGVIPDDKVPQQDALRVAYIKALEALAKITTSPSKRIQVASALAKATQSD